MARQRMIGVRVEPALYKAITARAKEEDRSVAYVARRALSEAFEVAEPKQGTLPDVDPRLQEAFDIIWHGWSFQHAAGVGSKEKAREAFDKLMRAVPANQWKASAELILACATETNADRQSEIDRGARDVIKLPQVHRYLSERRFEGTRRWQEERKNRSR